MTRTPQFLTLKEAMRLLHTLDTDNGDPATIMTNTENFLVCVLVLCSRLDGARGDARFKYASEAMELLAYNITKRLTRLAKEMHSDGE